MKKALTLIALSAILSGCHTAVKPTYTSAGNPGYRLDCGGFLGDGDLASCYQKAGEICQSTGYRVLQTSLSSIIIECRNTDASGKPAE